MDKDTAERLKSRLISLGGQLYRLLDILGAGATAVVFKARVESGDDEGKVRAIKFVGREDHARREIKNLRRLNLERSHFFPRLYHPLGNEGWRKTFVIDAPGNLLSAFVIVQDFVEAEGVDALLFEYGPAYRLPEPLGLAIGEQYVKMLMILHKNDITSWDRKLSDLRWKVWNRFRSLDDLQKWQRGEEPGQLTVIDWNVTDTASPENVRADLFRFGLLWHRMLLGVEPQSIDPIGEEPAHIKAPDRSIRTRDILWIKPAGWTDLSIPVQRILQNLLESKYQSAEELYEEIRKVVKYWRAPADKLLRDIEGVYEDITAGKQPTELEEALAKVDVLLHRKQDWGENIQAGVSLERMRRAIQRAEEGEFRLAEAISKHEWSEALDIVKKMRDKADAARYLWLRHYEAIIERAEKYKWAYRHIDPLIQWVDVIKEFDQGQINIRERIKRERPWEKWEKVQEPQDITHYQEWKGLRNGIVSGMQFRVQYLDLPDRLGQGDDVGEIHKETCRLAERHRDIYIVELLGSDSETEMLNKLYPWSRVEEIRQFLDKLEDIDQKVMEAIEALIRDENRVGSEPNPLYVIKKYYMQKPSDEFRSWLLKLAEALHSVDRAKITHGTNEFIQLLARMRHLKRLSSVMARYAHIRGTAKNKHAKSIYHIAKEYIDNEWKTILKDISHYVYLAASWPHKADNGSWDNYRDSVYALSLLLRYFAQGRTDNLEDARKLVKQLTDEADKAIKRVKSSKYHLDETLIEMLELSMALLADLIERERELPEKDKIVTPDMIKSILERMGDGQEQSPVVSPSAEIILKPFQDFIKIQKSRTEKNCRAILRSRLLLFGESSSKEENASPNFQRRLQSAGGS